MKTKRQSTKQSQQHTPIQVPLSQPDITEREIAAVTNVLRTPYLALGPSLRAFEQDFSDYIGQSYAIAVNSGTSALFLCLSALGIGPGDEVITTPFTFIASATCIMMTGAKPVFADIDPDHLNLNPNNLKTHITERTRAILPVEVFGNPTGIDRICKIAQDHQLHVVEDSCEALGSTLGQRKVGSFGDMSVFAFYPNKQITTGEGGMILTHNPAWAEYCISLRNQGRGKDSTWLIHERLGYNFRLSDINAALGRVQLSRIDEIMGKRRRVAHWYLERLANDERLILPQIPTDGDLSWFVFIVRLNETFRKSQRDALLSELGQRGIQASNYFPPVHLQPFIANQYGYRPGDFPVTESVSERTVALPFFNNLSQDQVDYVCRQLQQVLAQL